MKEIFTVLYVLMAVVLMSSTPLQASSYHRPALKSNALDYLMFVYDIIELTITAENQLNLEHDDQNPHNCMFVKSEEGLYSYISPGTTDASLVCGLYVVAEPTEVVEFEFKDFGVSCNNGGLLSVIDGWELNGQFFPSEVDHQLPRERRFEEFCGSKSPNGVFTTAQNVGLIEFRIPMKGQGFRVNVKFRENPYPCNVILQVPQGLYTIRNHGRSINCTASVLFPTSLTLINMDVTQSGVNNSITSLQQSGLSSDNSSVSTLDTSSSLTEASLSFRKECKESGCTDYLEVRGGGDLDPLFMSPVANFCGSFDSNKESIPVNGTRIDVGCGNTAIRLVSSGKTNNSVTIFLDLFIDLDASPCPRRSRRSDTRFKRNIFQRYYFHG